jgi:DNA-binding response OmpR family regulator
LLTSPFVTRAAAVGVDVSAPVSLGSLSVDLEGYDVRLGDQAIELTALQVELLALFLAAPTRVWSRQQLTWVCWRDSAEGRRVDVQLSRIRMKLGLDLFRNVRDRGWGLRQAPFPVLAAG